MGNVPSGVVAKLNRSRQLLQKLSNALAEFQALHPYRVEVSTNSDQTEHYLTIFGASDVPTEASLIASEVLHHLSGALDHMIYDMVKANHQEPSDRTAFPIFTDPSAYSARKKNGMPTPLSGLGKIEGCSQRVKDFIETLQPYHARTSLLDDAFNKRAMARDDLFVLHELARIDRHRFISVCHAFITMHHPRMLTGRPRPTRGGGTSVVLHDGLRFYHCAYRAPTHPDQVQYHYDIDYVLDAEWSSEFKTNSEGGVPSASRRLAGLLEKVEAVVSQLASLR